MGDFDFTPSLGNVSNRLWQYSAVASAGLCFLVLLVIFVVALDRTSRRWLDRVSFRIVCYSLVTNTVSAIANAVGGAFTGPTPACGFTIWILQLTLQLSSLLNFCIALNMQIVIVHGIDGRMAEKYYILGSILLSLLITIPPYAAKQYGWDEQEQDCWYANNDRNERLAWQIGTQIVWTAGAVIGEVVSSIILITFLWRHIMRRKRIVRSVNTIYSNNINRDVRPYVAGFFKSRIRTSSIDRQIDNVKAYKGIIIRIALYPIASCMMNLTSVATVLHTSIREGVHSRTDYNILLLSDFLYGGRGMVYAFLAATDPALVRAVKSFTRRFVPARSSPGFLRPLSRKPSDTIHLDTTIVHVEMDTIRNTDSGRAKEMELELTDMPKAPNAPDHEAGLDRKSAPPVGVWGDRNRFDEIPLRTSAMEAHDDGQASLEMQREDFERQI